MASILRALGIPVQGGEVKAAFKQALLKFHPDRVSRNDLYQQVKAEETFKFISHLKEKLPRFLC
uniref:J domain-containing protein n=1 Tax=Arundo donax TaxID=35708 RepID=A0A0A9F901_ARUDO